jgi:two-component system CheB/CheR fusion protein
MSLTSIWQTQAVVPEPIRRPLKQESHSEEETRPECQFKLRALVVDDSTDIALMLVMILQHAGYEAVMAVSATNALTLAQREHFDLIVSDIGMPEMDGYSFAKAIRSLPDYRTVPMIAVTGFAEYDDRDRARDAGFNTHVKKPIDPASFINTVKTLCS